MLQGLKANPREGDHQGSPLPWTKGEGGQEDREPPAGRPQGIAPTMDEANPRQGDHKGSPLPWTKGRVGKRTLRGRPQGIAPPMDEGGGQGPCFVVAFWALS
jgi:hypothetical protein